jgi:diguanylate cyclase (GGDEF)-like protein/PAS domain S-box-containing protein
MPLYAPGPRSQFVYARLRDRILSGDLPVGVKLPSQRELSADYGVSPMTARLAVSNLEDEGLVVRKPRRGTFVLASTARHDPRLLLETVWQTLGDAIMVATLDGIITGWNPAAERLFGYRADEIIGRHASILIPPDQAYAVQDIVGRLVAGQQVEFSQAVCVRKDGRRFDISAILSPLRDAHGDGVGFIAVAHDLARAKSAEADVRTAQERYRVLLDGAPIGISLADLQGNLIVANAAYQRLVGYTEDELRSMHFTDLTHPDDVEPDASLFAEAIAGIRGQYNVEKRYIRKDGETIWVRLTVLVPRDADGNPTYDIAMAEDITERRRAEEEIQGAARKLATQEVERTVVIEAMPSGVIVVDGAGTLVLMNQAARSILGMSPSSDIALAEQAARGGLRAAEQTAIPRALAGETVTNFEETFRRPGETEDRIVLASAAPLPDVDGSVRGAVAVFTDVTEERALTQQLQDSTRALRSSEARYRSLVESSPDGIVLASQDGTILMANLQTAAIHGYGSPADIVGLHASAMISEEDRPRMLADITRFSAASGFTNVEYQGLRLDGSVFPVEVSGTFSRPAEGAPATGVIIVRDISGRKALEGRLRHHALHDDLTDLPNRLHLTDLATRTIERAHQDRQMVAVLLLDLMRFKLINETFGRELGDLVLAEVGKRLGRLIRKTDILASLGGDEFVVVLEGADTAEALSVANVLRRDLEEPFLIRSQSLYLTPRFGVAVYPEHGTDFPTLLRRGDVAVQFARQRGESLQIYDAAGDQETADALTLVADLRRALGGDELELHFQPKIDLRTGDVRGVEALARWHHPTLGWIPPTRFTELAETSGLIAPLTVWVLHAALAQCAGWQKQGRPMNVAVNLSARSLHDITLADTIARALDQWSVDPSLLTLEITETSFMLNPAAGMELVRRLHEMGIRISIDDFGTGYSSLAYLQRLPADEVKIDGSFISGSAARGEAGAVIVNAIVKLAHLLGIETVAEGVETEESVRALREIGCDLAQGHVFARPLPPHELDAWMVGWGEEQRHSPRWAALRAPTRRDTLKADRRRFENFFENANDIMCTTDLEDRFTSMNRAGELITGYSRDELLRMTIADIVPPESAERARSMTQKKLQGEPSTTYEIEFLRKDGQRIPLEFSTRLIHIDGEPVGVQGIGRDITERRQAEEALRESEERFATAFGEAPIGMALVGTDGRWLQVNRSICELTGYSERELLARTFQDITYPADLETDLEYVRQMLAGEIDTYLMEKRYVRKDGQIVWVQLSVSMVHVADGSPLYFVSQIQDISDRRLLEQELRHRAHHDPLTGLPNRVLLRDRLEQSIEQAKRRAEIVAVLFVDLDGFKKVNDRLGHSAGDEALRVLAARLQGAVRSSDTVARLGGDEFVVILPNVGTTIGAEAVARTILGRVQEAIRLEGGTVCITASIGLALYPDDAEKAATIVKLADDAMYRAKVSGKCAYALHSIPVRAGLGPDFSTV